LSKKTQSKGKEEESEVPGRRTAETLSQEGGEWRNLLIGSLNWWRTSCGQKKISKKGGVKGEGVGGKERKNRREKGGAGRELGWGGQV